MADKKTYTGLSKNYATVPAFSITTIDYLDTKPNYFRVQNRGTTEIYCSTNNMPTTKHYDFAVAGKKMKMFAEPYNRTRLYIFNPSGSDVEVAVLSFQAEFEPLTLALSEIEVEMPKDFESSMAITSFNAPLPTGNNKIGKVEVTNSPAEADITEIKEYTHATADALIKLMGPPDSTSGKFNLSTIIEFFQLLLNKSPQDNMINLASFMPYVSLLTLATNIMAIEKAGENNGTLIYQGELPKCISIHMLKNDGTGDLAVRMYDGNASIADSPKILHLKPGESITDFKFYAKSLEITGVNYSFRGLFSVNSIPITNQGEV